MMMPCSIWKCRSEKDESSTGVCIAVFLCLISAFWQEHYMAVLCASSLGLNRTIHVQLVRTQPTYIYVRMYVHRQCWSEMDESNKDFCSRTSFYFFSLWSRYQLIDHIIIIIIIIIIIVFVVIIVMIVFFCYFVIGILIIPSSQMVGIASSSSPSSQSPPWLVDPDWGVVTNMVGMASQPACS